MTIHSKNREKKMNTLKQNKNVFQARYADQLPFYRYPNEYIIRFHHRYLKHQIPRKGKILDFGFGSGNNSVFFMNEGYQTYGVEVAESALGLLRKNLKGSSLPEAMASRFKIVPPDWDRIPFPDSQFDFILANHVLYYYPSVRHMRRVCQEFSRCLKPGGVVFITMPGWDNCIRSFAKKTDSPNIFQITPEAGNLALPGQLIYFVRSRTELTRLFSDFKTVDVGHYDEAMFNCTCSHYWMFVGKKQESSAKRT